MASLTRWVLAHKRIVILFGVVVTLSGMASAGSATKALKQKFSVPGKEGWVTNQQIARDFHGTGGNSAPLRAHVPVPPPQALHPPPPPRAPAGQATPALTVAGASPRTVAPRSSSTTRRPTPTNRLATTPRRRKKPRR